MSIQAGEAAKHEGMQRSYRAANPEWVALMSALVKQTASEMLRFTADDVFERYDAIRGAPMTAENRAFGAIMRQAAKLGYCKRTRTVEPSRRTELHRSPITIWESLICQAPN